MATYLSTRKAAAAIEDLITNAKEKLILVSPYFKISKDFKERLTYRDREGKQTTIVYGKSKLGPSELDFLDSLRHVALIFVEDLHAKCYASEQKIVLTSMNFYEYSMLNNKEMGILIKRSEAADSVLFQEIYKEIDFFIASGKEQIIRTRKSGASQPQETNKSIVEATGHSLGIAYRSLKKTIAGAPKAKGYCIRTGVKIPFNLKKPLSESSYEAWEKYKNIDYPEKYCHFSGEPSNGETCFSRPILKKHWNKAKQTHNL